MASLQAIQPANAQTVTALQDTTCAGHRAGFELSCNASEFTVDATFTAAPGTPAFCTAGQEFTFNASLPLYDSNTARYDIGFYVGQQGNSPRLTTAGNICSVAVFPTSPAPWGNLGGDNDACGDLPALGPIGVNPIIENVKVVCAASGGGTSLSIPYVVTYRQNKKNICTSAADVNSDSKSKCNLGIAEVQVDTTPLQVGGYVDITKRTIPAGDAQSFSFTASAADPGFAVGVEQGDVSINNFGDSDPSNNNTVDFTLADAETARVFMAVVPTTNRTLTITEQPGGQVTHWESDATIQCAASEGSPTYTTSNANRQVSASLNTINKGVACTITNTKRARVTLREEVVGKLYAADQFQLGVSGAGASTLTSSSGAAVAANLLAVTTSGAGTGIFANATYPSFYATPGKALTLATGMAPGSTSAFPDYNTTLTCTNASTSAGRTTVLPTNQATNSHVLNPKPGDDITCTYRHVPGALLTLGKTVINDDGLARVAADWTLTANGPTYISGAAGSAAVTAASVQPGTYTLSESGPHGYAMTGLVCTGAADSDPSDGLTLASGEIATCTFTNDDTEFAQTLVKSIATLSLDADGSRSVTEGDTLAYKVTLTNRGMKTLTNVQVSDAKLAPASQTCASVPSGATCVLNGTYVVTAADAAANEVVNTASVTSNEIATPLPSNTVTTPVMERLGPTLQVVKSHVGNFSAGGTGTYTLQVKNIGYGAITGTTTVTDTLDPRLQFVAASGSNWSCAVAGSPVQTVTCTSTAGIPSFGSMSPITLVVAIDGGIGASVDNIASVANDTLNGGTPVDGNTDTAIVLHPALSTSTKMVANRGGGSIADVDQGDVLRYTINLKESGGATASNVRVTDTIMAGLGNLTLVSLPPGATNNSSGNQLDISGITVPANTTVQVVFEVTVGGGFSAGAPIDNTAHIDNPGGSDADPVAPTLYYARSLEPWDGEKKVLYLHSAGGTGVLNRLPHAGIDTSGTSLGGQADWVLAPALSNPLTLEPGTIDVQLSLTANGSVYAALFDGGTPIGSASNALNLNAGTPEVHHFQIDLATPYTVAPGRTLTLRVYGSGTVYDFNVEASKISFDTSTVVHVESIEAYTAAYSGGSVPEYFFPGDTAYLRVVASDPFGGSDVSASDSRIVITDPNGVAIVPSSAMTEVDISGATKTFEHVLAIPADAVIGQWTVTATAYEGTEGTIHHTSSSTFEVRGRVTLDQAWGFGAKTGDSLALQIGGGSDASDGSSVATNPAIPATAAATGAAAITLSQSFTSGSAGMYTVGLACVRDFDGSAVPTTGGGLSRQIQMPLEGSVTCTWTNLATTGLTLAKLAIVHSDPINGTSAPKAIPGAIVEYQIVVTNPGNAVDSGSVFVIDPLPAQIELRVADISGPGTGPVRFVDGSPSSGLTYSYPADIAFSNDGGLTWTYVPSDPDSDGIDPNVTDIRINPKGVFKGNTTGNPTNDASFTLIFRVRVK